MWRVLKGWWGRRGGGSGPTGRKTRAVRACEQLEARTFFSVVVWDGGPQGTGTDWHNPENWVGDTVPIDGDEVSIGAGGGIEYASGVLSLTSLSCNRPLAVTGGSLGATIATVSDLLTLDGGGLSGGSWALSGPGLAATEDPGNILTAVTINGDIALSGENSFLRITGGLTVNGLVIMYGNGSTLAFDGGVQMLSGNCDVLFGGVSGTRHVSAVSDALLTIAPSVSFTGERGKLDSGTGSGTIINQGTIWADTPFRTIEISPSVFTNQGTLRSTGDGVLLVRAGIWVNDGIVSINQGTLRLGGTFDITQGIGEFHRTGGEVLIDGTLLNANSTLLLGTATGSWRFNNGQIIGGQVDLEANATLASNSQGSGRLSGVTVNGNLSWIAHNFSIELDGVTINGDVIFSGVNTMTITNGLVLNGAMTVSQANALIRFEGAVQTLSGAATISLQHDECYFWSFTTVTLDAGVSLSGFGRVYGDFISAGQVSANSAAAILTIARGAFQNEGTMIASAGGHLRIGDTAAGVSSYTNTGTLLVTANSILRIAPNSTSGPQTFTNSGLLRMEGLSHAGVGNLFIFNLITVINTGTVEVAEGATFLIGTPTAFTPVAFQNTGIMRAQSGGIIMFATDLTTDNLGDVRAEGGSVVLQRPVINTGRTLAINSTTGSWIVSGAEIIGGTLSFSQGRTLLFDGSDMNTLDGVSIQGEMRIDQIGAKVRIVNGLTVNGVVLISGENAVVWFDGGVQSISGTGTINLTGSDGHQKLSADAAAAVIIGGGITVTAGFGEGMASITAGAVAGEGGAWTNLGKLSGRLVIDATLASPGTIEVRDGLTMSIQGPVTTFSNGTLAAGTWVVGQNSVLEFGPGNITTNKAHFTLEGAGASCAALGSLENNEGTLVLAGGKDLAVAASLTNLGTLDLGPGSDLSIPGSLTLGASSTLKLKYAPAQAPTLTSSTAMIAGALAVSWYNGYTPPATLPAFLNAASISGLFSSFSPQSVGVRAKQGLVYTPTSVSVAVNYLALRPRV